MGPRAKQRAQIDGGQAGEPEGCGGAGRHVVAMRSWFLWMNLRRRNQNFGSNKANPHPGPLPLGKGQGNTQSGFWGVRTVWNLSPASSKTKNDRLLVKQDNGSPLPFIRGEGGVRSWFLASAFIGRGWSGLRVHVKGFEQFMTQ